MLSPAADRPIPLVWRGDRYACENVNKLLVGNKSDLEAKRAVTTEEAKVRLDGKGLQFT